MAERRGCIRMEVDDSKYSSFVPVIGMYIAAVSLVCFVAMLHDILSIFCHRKRWLPCNHFSLNSLTLTLIGVAAKLPVDLTTPMPSRMDQFSKLCGNSFICISMGFLMPSLGVTPEKETVSNLFALSILVVTVVVNTCVQIRTGVVFFFVIEHVIVMCCMLALLFLLWMSGISVGIDKDISIDHNKNCFTKGKGSMLQRLKVAYLFGCSHNPQFLVSVSELSVVVAELCIVCSVVIFQAVVRGLSLGFCGGSSDYRWSVWVIVLVQVFTVFVGSFATVFRSLGLSRKWKINLKNTRMREENMKNTTMREETPAANPLLRRGSTDKYFYFFVCLLFCLPLFLLYVFHVPFKIVMTTLRMMFHLFVQREHTEGTTTTTTTKPLSQRENKRETATMTTNPLSQSQHKEDIDVKKYKKRITDGGEEFLWSPPARQLIKSVKDMIDLKRRSKRKSVENILELLRRTGPSRNFTTEVSPLSMVLLIRIVQVLVPREHSDPLVRAYREAEEILHFVEDRMKLASMEKREKSEAAKALWVGNDLSTILPQSSAESQLEKLKTVEEILLKKLPNGVVLKEARMVIELIKDDNNKQTEPQHTPSDFIQQLFVDMLHMFLTQVPHAIYKEVTESTAEDFYGCVKRSLGILWKIKPLALETLVQWSFPLECDICDLIALPPPDTQLQVVSLEQEQHTNFASQVHGDHDDNISANHDEDDITVRVE